MNKASRIVIPKMWKSFDSDLIRSTLLNREKPEVRLITNGVKSFVLRLDSISRRQLYLSCFPREEINMISKDLHDLGRKSFLYIYQKEYAFLFRVQISSCFIEGDRLIVPFPGHALLREKRFLKRKLVLNGRGVIHLGSGSRSVTIINFHEYGAQVKLIKSNIPSLKRGDFCSLTINNQALNCLVIVKYIKTYDKEAFLGLAFSDFTHVKLKYVPEYLEDL